jgi:hypothetical protein
MNSGTARLGGPIGLCSMGGPSASRPSEDELGYLLGFSKQVEAYEQRHR